MKLKNPEILAPGGDFNSAIHGLKSGADAVYIGLSSYSARKRAKNLTMDEVRRLKEFCRENSKKLYVALNTLVTDKEIADLYPILKELDEIKIDAVILQDLGLISLVKSMTALTIHGSTQLAVHNIHGVRKLFKMGVSRVVLSRELTLNEIKKINADCPEMELEVFIHGALCYGFSGLCLASSFKLCRSANRGECGQICRTWFKNQGREEFCFSMNDLLLGETVLKLKEAGVDSLKIEGRMKGPAYASITSELYYNILNGKVYNEQLKQSRIEFNRSGGDSYLLKPSAAKKINRDYPGHTGIYIGEVSDIRDNSFKLITDESIENRDGLMVYPANNPGKPVKFPCKIIKREKNGFILEGRLPKNAIPELYKISNHDKHLKEENPQSYKPYKTPVDLKVSIERDKISIQSDRGIFSYSIDIEEARNSVDIEKQFYKVFYAGGDTNYNFITLVNSSITNPFIPMSTLKEIRNSFQSDYESLKTVESLNIPESTTEYKSYIKNRDILPFITDFKKVDLVLLEVRGNKYLLPMAPVVFNSEEYLENLKNFLNSNRDKEFIIGLNNISHLEFIQELDETLTYYCDYGLYSLNSFSSDFLSREIPNLLWITKWIEADKPSDYPPIFISRTCFISQSKGCPVNCPKEYELDIQQDQDFKVIVRDCISYTLTRSEPRE